MKYIIIFLPLLLGSISISVIARKKIEECLSNWIFLTVLILYIFGIFKLLVIGFYFVLGLSIIGTLISIIMILKTKKINSKLIIRPGLLAFIIFSVLSIIAQEGRLLTAWDEFSHWGLAAKNMYILDALYNHPMARIQFPGYPPGITLFQYFNSKLSGGFQESTLYLSTNLLYFSMAVYIFKNMKWNDIFKILFALIVILILPNIFYKDFYFSLYVDGILGIIFGYTLFRYFICKKSTFDLISIALSLFMLSMSKASGVGLSVLAVIIIFSDMLYANKTNMGTADVDTKKINLKKIILPLSLLFAIVFAKVSWEAYLKLTSTKGAWDTSGLSLTNILTFLKREGPDYQTTTFFGFISAFFNNKISSNDLVHSSFSEISAYIFTFSIFCASYLQNSNERNRYFVVHSLIFLESIIYALSLLLLYMFTYSEYEAVRLASSDRYLSTFVLGSFFFSISILIYKSKEYQSRKIFKILLSAIASILIFLNYIFDNDTSIISPPSTAETAEFREHYSPIEDIKEFVGTDEKVFFLSQGSSGIAYHISRYLILPTDLDYEPFSYSIGSPKREVDIWTMEVSDTEFIQTLLEEYDYIYIFHTDSEFNDRYGNLFKKYLPADRTLYKIVKSSNDFIFEKVN